MVFFKLIKIFTVLFIIFCFRFKWNEASVEQKVQFKEMFSELIKKVSRVRVRLAIYFDFYLILSYKYIHV